MKHFLLWLFPELRDDLESLRSANSKVVIENSRLYDEILILKNVDHRSIRVDVSIAKQLQASIERNGRMVARLRVLEGKIAITPIASPDIFRAVGSIIKDEEPTWPGA